MGERSFGRILTRLSQARTQIRRPLKEGADTNFGTPLALGILIFLQLTDLGALAQEPQYAAVIQKLTGDVFLIATHGAEGQKVDPANSEGHVLYVGETLHLNQDAYVKISVFDHHEEAVKQSGPCDYKVPDKATRAILRTLNGDVVLVTPGSNEPQKLNAKNSKARNFRAGDVLRLGQNASVSLDVYYDDKEVIEKTGQCDYTVPQTGAKTDAEKIIDEVQKISGIGGRTAFGEPSESAFFSNNNYGFYGGGIAEDIVIFSPAPGEAVLPKEFTIALLTPSAEQPWRDAKAWIADEKGKTVWKAKDFPAIWGPLEELIIDSGEDLMAARMALSNEAGKALHLTIELVAAPTRFNETTVQFKVLSVEQTASLNAELSALDRTPEPLKPILRARVFAKYEMFSQAAHEYEQALKLAPDSRAVLDAAISAYHRTGNGRREYELLSREENAGGWN